MLLNGGSLYRAPPKKSTSILPFGVKPSSICLAQLVVRVGGGRGVWLFAIFSCAYRTDPIPPRDYLLVLIIACRVVNSVVVARAPIGRWPWPTPDDGVALYPRREWGFRYEYHPVAYDKIDLIVTERQQSCWPTCARARLAIQRIEIGRKDFIHDSAEVTVYYDARARPGGEPRRRA
jgi:hypothetical protein